MPAHGIFVNDLVGCVRCHGDHAAIEWRPLTYPITDSDGSLWTHWAPCPANGEPILSRFSDGDE